MRTTLRQPNTYRALVTVKEHRAFKLHELACVELDETFRELDREVHPLRARRVC